MQHGSLDALRQEVKVLRRENEQWRRYALLQEGLAQVGHYRRKAERLEEELDRLKAWTNEERLAWYRQAGLTPCRQMGSTTPGAV